MPRKNRGRRRKDGGASSGKMVIIKSNQGSSNLASYFPIDDARRTPPNRHLSTMRVPRKINDQIHWFKGDTSNSFALSTTTGVNSELNQAFVLSNLATLGPQIAALFDQYTIFAVLVKTQITQSGTTVGANPRYFTAIDYDNITNISATANIQAFGSVCCTELGTIQERYIEPCVAISAYQGAFTAFANERLWVDNASPSAAFYGFRFMCEPLGTGASGQVTFEYTYIVAARNSV